MFPLGDAGFDAVAAIGDYPAYSVPGRRLLRLMAQQPDAALAQLQSAPEWVLLERWPGAAALIRAADAGHQFGVYLPSDAPHPTNRLGLPTDRAAALERLRRLALVLGAPRCFVLADADAIADALHYAELVAPHAGRLLLLGGTPEQRARVQAAFAAAKS